MDTFNIYNKIVHFEYIKIKGNRLKIIKSGLFFSDDIKQLDLSNNTINSFEINALNVKLKILKSYSNVDLSTIAQYMFGNMKKLKNDTVLNNTIMCNCQTFNWTFKHKILKIWNVSKHYYIVCNQLISIFKNCTINKGNFIYIYIYIYNYYYGYNVIYINTYTYEVYTYT